MSENAVLEPLAQIRRQPLRGTTTDTAPSTDAPASVQLNRPVATKPRTITPKTWERLTPRQQAYVASYVLDGKALQAYLAAGYVQSVNGHPQQWLMRRAYSVRRGQAVATAILEDRERRAQLEADKQEHNLDSIVAELDRLKDLAVSKGDLAVAVRAVELVGKTRGFFTDGVRVDEGQRREYSEAERVEAARLSRMLLTEGDSGESKALEGDSVQDSDDSAQAEDGDHGAAARS